MSTGDETKPWFMTIEPLKIPRFPISWNTSWLKTVSLLWAIIIPSKPGSIIPYSNQLTRVFLMAQLGGYSPKSHDLILFYGTFPMKHYQTCFRGSGKTRVRGVRGSPSKNCRKFFPVVNGAKCMSLNHLLFLPCIMLVSPKHIIYYCIYIYSHCEY